MLQVKYSKNPMIFVLGVSKMAKSDSTQVLRKQHKDEVILISLENM